MTNTYEYSRVWMITCKQNGFKYKILLRGTESEMRAYVDTELPQCVTICGATDEEVEAARKLAMPVYCC